jgi:V-type H+-transporting ATPase subunit H
VCVCQKLVRLAGGDDEDVAAVACYDLGEFARNYPNGRAISKRLMARNVVMALIEHDHPELQKQALACISKMLVSNWRVCTCTL